MREHWDVKDCGEIVLTVQLKTVNFSAWAGDDVYYYRLCWFWLDGWHARLSEGGQAGKRAEGAFWCANTDMYSSNDKGVQKTQNY